MKRTNILIKNAFIVTMNKKRELIENGFVSILDDKVEAIGKMDEISQYDAVKVIDAEGKAVFPGFISTHTHLFQTMLKGIGKDRNLMDWLTAAIFPAQRSIDQETITSAALLGCIDAIRSGTTTVLDYQYTHGFKDMDQPVIDAMLKSGIRGIFGRGYSNTSDFPEEYACEHIDNEELFFADTRKLYELYKNHSRISIAMAPGIVWAMENEESFTKMHELCEELDIVLTMHINETKDDDNFSLERYGCTTVELLEKTGMLSPRLLSVHSIHLTDKDLELYKKYDVKVSHNPAANMILASGVAPIPEMLDMGITCSLALDGAASNDTQDMMETLKLTAFTHKQNKNDPAVMTSEQILEMATIDGAKSVLMETEIGSLEIGKKADLFVFNPHKSRSSVMHDPIAGIVYSGGQDNIETTIIDGNIVMENNVILTLDEDELYKKAKKIGEELLERLGYNAEHWGQKFRF